jgi:hypothetical protein
MVLLADDAYHPSVNEVSVRPTPGAPMDARVRLARRR